MDALTDSTMVQAVVVLGVVVVLIGIAMNSLSSTKPQQQSALSAQEEEAPPKSVKKKKESKKQNNNQITTKQKEIQQQPKKVEEVVAPSTESAAGKKKKKKKGATKGSEPESVPEPELVPEPEPVVIEPEAAGKKKKKKKNKKKKVGGDDVNTKPFGKETSDDDDDDNDEDEEDDDEDDVALLLKSRKQSKGGLPATNGQSKNKKKEEPPKKPEPPAPAPVVVAAVDPNAVRSITHTIEVSDKPILVGPKGATIQGIQFESNARLDISGTVLKITGTEAAVASALEQVKKVLDDYKEEQRRATASTTTLSGKQINGSDGVKAIIGKGGATIQSIQTETGCKLDADVAKGTVVITGPTEEQVSRAATLCKHAVFGESQHVMELGNVGTVMIVYGKDFAKIRQFQTDSGAKLDIAKGSTTLEISGPTEAVANARRMVQEWIDYCKGEVIMMEANKIGAVYGKGGITVRGIQEKTGAIVQVDDQGKKGKEMVACQILGEPVAVQQAKELVLKALDGDVELKPGEVMVKMDLDVGAPAVIGRGGAKIRELEAKFAVKLLVNGNIGTIAGKKEAVDKAQQEIQKIITPLIEEKRIAAEAERLAIQAQSGADPGPWGGKFDDAADGW